MRQRLTHLHVNLLYRIKIYEESQVNFLMLLLRKLRSRHTHAIEENLFCLTVFILNRG